MDPVDNADQHDASAAPDSRRYLLRADVPEAVVGRLEQYAAITAGPHRFVFRVHRPWSGWVQVDVPLDLPLWHFHNLAKWIEAGGAGAEAPETFFALSHGDSETWDYWLGRPPPGREHSAWLSGATSQARPLQVDCARGTAHDELERRTESLTPRLAMLQHKVPMLLMNPGHQGKLHAEVTLALAEAPSVDWQLPERADITEGFERTPGPRTPFEQASDRFWGMFKRGDKSD